MSITHLLRVIRVSGNASKELFLSTLFPKEWINENIDYIERNFVFPMGKIPAQNLLQSQAAGKWEACDRLSNITNPTLVAAGSEDITAPPANSVMMAEKIPGAWLIQIKGGGHGLIFQVYIIIVIIRLKTIFLLTKT
jgi:pimeloyl-ACP methyl ester carboxylesterase